MRFLRRVPQLHAVGLAERLDDRRLLVLDVREPREWRRGHIRGSHNVPLSQLAGRLSRIPLDRPVVTVCASGHRSAAAARILMRACYEVENLAGGLTRWSRAGLPLAR